MTYKTHAPGKRFPCLVIERSQTLPGGREGLLQINGAGTRISLGSPESREFRLVQCLFSPKNFISAKYEPVVQTHERVFEAIRSTVDDDNKRLAHRDSAEGEMTAIVERSLRALQKKVVGEYVSFISREGRVCMEIA